MGFSILISICLFKPLTEFQDNPAFSFYCHGFIKHFSAPNLFFVYKPFLISLNCSSWHIMMFPFLLCWWLVTWQGITELILLSMIRYSTNEVVIGSLSFFFPKGYTSFLKWETHSEVIPYWSNQSSSCVSLQLGRRSLQQTFFLNVLFVPLAIFNTWNCFQGTL